jgi:hypothetical protein
MCGGLTAKISEYVQEEQITVGEAVEYTIGENVLDVNLYKPVLISSITGREFNPTEPISLPDPAQNIHPEVSKLPVYPDHYIDIDKIPPCGTEFSTLHIMHISFGEIFPECSAPHHTGRGPCKGRLSNTCKVELPKLNNSYESFRIIFSPGIYHFTYNSQDRITPYPNSTLEHDNHNYYYPPYDFDETVEICEIFVNSDDVEYDRTCREVVPYSERPVIIEYHKSVISSPVKNIGVSGMNEMFNDLKEDVVNNTVPVFMLAQTADVTYDSLIRGTQTESDVFNPVVPELMGRTATATEGIRADVRSQTDKLVESITGQTADVKGSIDTLRIDLQQRTRELSQSIDSSLEEVERDLEAMPERLLDEAEARAHEDLITPEVVPTDTIDFMAFFDKGSSWLPAQCPEPISFSIPTIGLHSQFSFSPICAQSDFVRIIVDILSYVTFLGIIIGGVRSV